MPTKYELTTWESCSCYQESTSTYVGREEGREGEKDEGRWREADGVMISTIIDTYNARHIRVKCWFSAF